MASRLLELWRRSSKAPKEVGFRWRFYRSNPKVIKDLKTLKPLILQRIQNQVNDNPVNGTILLAQQVLKNRALLYNGVSNLLHHLPVWSCKCCGEVYVGESGHLIRTCGGYRQRAKIKVHKWIRARLNDILVPVKAYHVQDNGNHDRIPAVVKLCIHAGATVSDQTAYAENKESETGAKVAALSDKEIKLIGTETLKAWEELRNGVQKLLWVVPMKVCTNCSEVHLGVYGNEVQLCGVHRKQIWARSRTHILKKAEVDDLVPQKIVWYRRPQDPQILLDEGRDYYGHAPAVVDMCVKAGEIAPSKYFKMMKLNGLSWPD